MHNTTDPFSTWNCTGSLEYHQDGLVNYAKHLVYTRDDLVNSTKDLVHHGDNLVHSADDLVICAFIYFGFTQCDNCVMI